MLVPDPRCERLSELSQCAYRLGLAFGAEAERAGDAARTIEYFHLFDRCFFAVRVATALELRLRQAPGTYREDRAERDVERPDPPEREPERGERDRDTERDRDRETEPASLPLLLKTLHGVAAADLPGPEPAALSSLRELLAQVTSETAGPAPAAPPKASTLRARLAGSATVAVATLAPPRAGPRIGLPRLPATGPPRR